MTKLMLNELAYKKPIPQLLYRVDVSFTVQVKLISDSEHSRLQACRPAIIIIPNMLQITACTIIIVCFNPSAL